MASKVYAVLVGPAGKSEPFDGSVIAGILPDAFPAMSYRETIKASGFRGNVTILGLSDQGVASVVRFGPTGGPIGEFPVDGQLPKSLWSQLKDLRSCLLGGMRHGSGCDEAQAEQDLAIVSRGENGGGEVDLESALDGTETASRKRGRRPGGDAA